MTYKHTPGGHFEQHVQREREAHRADKPNGHADQPLVFLRRASTVETSNNIRTGTEVSRALPSREVTCVAISEWPPSAKKLS